MCNLYLQPEYIVEENSTDFSGIMSTEELAVLQESICATIRYPTTIIDRSNRYDANRIGYILNKCCDTFRKCGGMKYCLKCDKLHADILLDSKCTCIAEFEQFINGGINSFYEALRDDYNQYYASTKEYPYFFSYKGSRHGFLEYWCPITGLKELIFPIFFNNKVLGVVFVGQFRINDLRKKTQDIRLESITKYENVFKQHIIKSNKPYGVDKIFDAILESDETVEEFELSQEEIESHPGFYNQHTNIQFDNVKSFREFACKTIVPQIINLEREFDIKLNEKRKNFINQKFIEFQNVLEKKINEEYLMKRITKYGYSDLQIEEFWIAAQNVFKQINDFLDFEYINLFVYENDFVSQDCIFKLVCSTMLIGTQNEITVDEQHYNKLANSIYLTRDDKGNLKNQFLYEMLGIPENMGIDIISSSNINQNYILLIKQSNACESTFVKGFLCKMMQEFTTSCLNKLLFVKNLISNDLTNKILRLYRHEISHLVLGLSGNNDYLKDPIKLKSLSNEKIRDIFSDHESCIELLTYMTQNIEVFTGSITSENIVFEEFKIFKELIWKWENLYKTDCEAKKIRFQMPDIRVDHDQWLEARPLIKSNKLRLEQIVYNIVNNALKYSYDGTKIYLDCQLIKNDPENHQCFSVIDYGHEITNDQTIPYQLYYRDKELASKIVDGSGIGLYIASTTAKILGVKIQHKCRQICRYNVPLIKRYLGLPTYYLRRDIDIDELSRQLNQLMNSGDYDRVVNKSAIYDFPISKITRDIDKPTFEVTFEVII